MKNIYLSSLFMATLLLCSTASMAKIVNINNIVYDIAKDSKTATVVHYSYTFDSNTEKFIKHGCECKEYIGEITIPESVKHEGVKYKVKSIGCYALAI